MRAAHFTRSLTEPGIWLATTTVDGKELTIPIDLIVPEGVAPPGGRRGARLGPHGNRAARRAVGLEAALVDHSPMTVTALEPSDTRQFEVEVAGVAAMFVAKAHKIHDRLESNRPGRAEDKDAADVYRLMQTHVADRRCRDSRRSDARDSGTRNRGGDRLSVRAVRATERRGRPDGRPGSPDRDP